MPLKEVMTPGVEVIAPEAEHLRSGREDAPPGYRPAPRL